MTVKDAKIMVDYIKGLKPVLKPFEEKFLNSIEELYTAGSISDKQAKTLIGIYERASGGGLYANIQRL